MIRAVVFDLDGVLIDSEQVWDQARRHFAAEHGGAWPDDATTAMQGMSSHEWARYMRDALGVDLPPEQISDLVVGDLLERYREHLPLLPGAVDAVQRMGARWPLGLASSSNRVVIDTVLSTAGLTTAFAATASSEEVPRGKPAPDVYLDVARRLQEKPRDCVAVEDSTNGIRSAVAAAFPVVAVPNHEYPPRPDALAQASRVLENLNQLTVDMVEEL